MTDKIYDSIVGMEEQEAIKLAKEYLDGGGDPKQLLDVCRDAMDEVGKKFESGEYFLSELLLGGEIFISIMEITLPLLEGSEMEKLVR